MPDSPIRKLPRTILASAAAESDAIADLSVTTAKLAPSAVTAAKISAGAVGNAALDPRHLQFAAVEITAAQLKTMRAAAVQILEAPGSGFFWQFVQGVLVLDYGTSVFTETADNLQFKIGNAAGVAVSEAIEMTGFIDQAGDMMTTARPKLDAIATKAQLLNLQLSLHNVGDSEFGGNAANDSVLRVYVWYRRLQPGW